MQFSFWLLREKHGTHSTINYKAIKHRDVVIFKYVLHGLFDYKLQCHITFYHKGKLIRAHRWLLCLLFLKNRYNQHCIEEESLFICALCLVAGDPLRRFCMVPKGKSFIYRIIPSINNTLMESVHNLRTGLIQFLHQSNLMQ